MAIIDVRITFSNGQFVPSIDPVRLSKGKGDTIHWHNDTTQNLKIGFDGSCPFHSPSHPYEIHPGHFKPSGGIHCDPDTNWSYTISSPAGPITDPQVIVEK